MTPVFVIGWALVGLSLSLAAYALVGVVHAINHQTSPRPFALPVFSLLAFGAMKACWLVGGFVCQISEALAVVLLLNDLAIVASIGWLLFHTTKRTAR